MIINNFQSHLVRLPLEKPFGISRGVQDTADLIIVKLFTDTDIVGIGFSAPNPFYSEETAYDVKIILDKYLMPAVIGKDPMCIETLVDEMEKRIVGHPMAKAAIDIALHDILAKTLGVPLYKILGGAYREKIPVLCGPAGGVLATPKEIAIEVGNFVHHGFKTIKLKVGRDINRDVEAVKVTREVVGKEISIRVDANQGYTRDIALKAIKKMERYEIEMIEQPLPRWDLEGMAMLARSVDTPILADESVFSIQDAFRVIRLEAADIINIKIQRVGGFHNAKKIEAVAEAAGIPCLIGGMVEDWIGVACQRHFAATMKGELFRTGSGGGVDPLIDDVVKESLGAPEHGFVETPKGPGLGIELDERKVSKYSISLESL